MSKWESAHHTVPQLWLPASLMKDKCSFKSVTVKDPLTNSVVCDIMFKESFLKPCPSALCKTTSIPVCFWLSHLESCSSVWLFIAPWTAFQYQLPSVVFVQVFLAVKCYSGPSLCSLDLESNRPTKLQLLHPGESLSFQPNQQKCSVAPDCCLIGY